MQTFIFKKVELSETDMMEQIYRLRFQVYCRECGFIQEKDYPNGVEIDAYDKDSVHFAAIDEEGYVIGTMRMILADKVELPLENHCKSLTVGKDSVQRENLAEISRLVISKTMRKRWNDGKYYSPQVADVKISDPSGHEFLRRAKPMAFGLYREIYRESKRHNITHWYALMEKGLWLLLKIHGFTFESIGEEVDVFGIVRPYVGMITNIEQEVCKKFPKFFDYFIEELEQEHLPSFYKSC